VRLEDYALIGDRGTAALVGIDGSIDWLCAPRFDSPAMFAALLGDAKNGRWRIAPADPVLAVQRRYRKDTLVLETDHTTAAGIIRTTDFMPALRDPGPRIVRIVECLTGEVAVDVAVTVRFDYGDLPPWTRAIDGGCTMTAVGDAMVLRTDAELQIEEHDPSASFTLRAGERRSFALAWYPSHQDPSPAIDPDAACEETMAWWREWATRIDYDGAYPEQVRRSLFMLKALIYAPSGASVAAVTTSLPETLGGSKNWDYRYAWVRDSAYTIAALLHAGLVDEARDWRDWVLCALAGRPENLQIMYGVTGDRRIEEYELPLLGGYEGATPVRIGNAAYTQFQLGIYGETMGAIYFAHECGVEIDASAWAMISDLLEHVERIWEQPDAGIWESRGAPRHYTHSKMLAWSAFDRAVRAIDDFGFRGPRDRWKAIADRIHADVLAQGFDTALGAFTQAYGSHSLDAAVLVAADIGFLPATDERMRSTVAAIERTLMHDGFLYRTSQDPETNAAVSDHEGAFLACNFWLADAYALQGRNDDARRLFERVAAIAGPCGLLAEEYDPAAQRMVGNIPQTLSHASLINTACRLTAAAKATREGLAASA
jgi:GH15 family glucan-1,4-alpha-glucosidase